jgi:hypothetical protein
MPSDAKGLSGPNSPMLSWSVTKIWSAPPARSAGIEWLR